MNQKQIRAVLTLLEAEEMLQLKFGKEECIKQLEQYIDFDSKQISALEKSPDYVSWKEN